MWIKACSGIPAVAMKAGNQFERYGTVTINCYHLSNCAARLLSWSRGGNGFCVGAAEVSRDRPVNFSPYVSSMAEKGWVYSQVWSVKHVKPGQGNLSSWHLLITTTNPTSVMMCAHSPSSFTHRDRPVASVVFPSLSYQPSCQLSLCSLAFSNC